MRAMATPQDRSVDAPTDPTVAARRSAALVAAVTAFVVPPWFIASLAVVGSYKDDATRRASTHRIGTSSSSTSTTSPRSP